MPKFNRKYRYREMENHPGMFEIESWSSNEKHTVHIFDNEGNGSCSCKDFGTRCYPNWKNNGHQIVDYGITGNANPKRTQCRHLKFICWKWSNKVRYTVWKQEHSE